MPKLTQEQAREKLFQTASKLTIDQIPAIFAALKKVLDEMSGEFLWPAVKTAHQAKEIKPETFARNLFVSDGLIKPIHRKTEKWDDLADPYDQLDIKIWCVYLQYGKDRILDRRVSPIRKAKDQDAFFEFIRVPLNFLRRFPDGTNKEEEHNEFTAFKKRLNKVHTARNWIEHENYRDATLEELATAVLGLSDILSKMNYTGWKEERDLWQKRLLRVFFNAIGEIDYSVAAVMDYMQAVGCTVSDQQQSAVEQLMTDAGMAVAGGKVSFSGNILNFISGELAEAWSLAQTDWTAGAEKVSKALKGPLPPYALLSEGQKLRAVEILEKYSPELKGPLVEAVRAAHIQAGIAQQTFEDNLYIVDGTGGKPLLDAQYRWKADADPYNRLDLHGWLKYLRFGGCRLDANGDPVEDQDAVFDFLNIPYPNASDSSRRLNCEFAKHLERLNDARNDITSHWTPATVEKTTTQEIMQWYESLLAVLKPLCCKEWQAKDTCVKLMEDIKNSFKSALGGLTYSVADILNYLNMSKDAKPEVEKRLAELGYPVSDSGVTIDEDIESFMTTLPVALNLMQDMRRLPESIRVNQEHTQWVKKRARASEERAVRWFEKGAYGPNPVPAALYYLGSCGLYGRGTAIDGAEAMAMIHSAAKKGYALAQVRMGMYCENWYGQLRKARLDEAVAWYQKAADQENADGQYYLGQYYGTQAYMGDLAYHYYWAAEQQGHMPAKLARGELYSFPLSDIQWDIKKAEKIYLELVEQEYVPAMTTLAQLYTSLRAGQPDIEKAKALYLKAVNLGEGDVVAFKELAKAYLWGSFRGAREWQEWRYLSNEERSALQAEDDKEAVRWLTMAAKKDDAEAMCWLGSCYQSGVGTEKDEKIAFHWIKKAVDQGHHAAKWDLANCYAAGAGVIENMDTAQKLYGEMEDNYYARRMWELLCAKERIKTNRTWRDETEALELCQSNLWALMRREAEWNDEQSILEDRFINYGNALFQYELAEFYMIAFELQANISPEKEEAVQRKLLEKVKHYFSDMLEEDAQKYQFVRVQEEDLKKAAALYEKAAKTGLKKAMHALGRCYEQGIGVDKDVYQAIAWYKKAARGGNVEAMIALADCYLQNTDALSDTMDAQTAKQKAIKAYQLAYRYGAKESWDKLWKLGVLPGS